MAFFQLMRMVLLTLASLALLGWVPWMLIRPLRARVNGWIALPFLGLAVLETFSWYWLEFGSGGLRTGLIVLGAVWLASAVLIVINARSRGARLLPPITDAAVVPAVLLIGVAIILSALTMMRGLQGSEPVPTTFGNADTAQYALSSEVLVDEDFDGTGWISGAELGELGRSDNGAVRPFLAAVALINGTSVWNATSPAMAVFVVLIAIAAAWLVIVTTRAGPMVTVLLALSALLPFSLVFIVGQQYLAQVAAMAGALALAAVILQNRPTTWRDAAEAAIPATFVVIPMMLTYPQMALASLVIIGIISVLVALESFGRMALIDTVKSMARSGAQVALSSAAALIVLTPAVSSLVDRVRVVGGATFGWPLPLLSPPQILGVEDFTPMTAISRSAMIGASNSGPMTSTKWWMMAFVVIGLAAGASALSIVRRGKTPLFPVASATVVLVSYRLFYDREGDSYAQWKWITFFQPVLTIAMVVSLWVFLDAALQHFSGRRRSVSACALALGIGLACVTLGLVVRLWAQPWWYVTDDLADVRRVAASGLERVNVSVDDYAETMWAGYFLRPIQTNLRSASYFPRTGSTEGWTVTKDPYVKSMPLREVPLNSTYRLVCFKEPCGPTPVLPPRG